MKIDSVITLENDVNCLLLEKVNYNNDNYFLTVVLDDNEEQSARRPKSITLVVKNGDEEVQSKVVSNSDLVDGTTNQWSVEFTGLDKYDSEGIIRAPHVRNLITRVLPKK